MNNNYGDEINRYINLDVPKKNRRGINKKTLIIGIIIVIIALIVFLALKNNKSSFYSYEEKMISKAREYVSNNGISTNKEMYIDVSKLDTTLPDNCSLLSGVIYDGNDYTAYLVCNDYESEIVNNDVDDKSDFELNGNGVIVLLKGMEYNELGYKCNELVNVTSTDIKEPGVYNIYYILSKSDFIFSRKVIVIDNDSLKNNYPAINISSDNPVIVKRGTEYNEQISAVDSYDGDLTDKVTTNGNVDTNTDGEYKVVYSVRNSMGYTASVAKKVVVLDSSDTEMNIMTSLSNDNITNESIKATVSITGYGYSYTKLPDGTTTSEKEFEYDIEENGEYVFTAVGLNDDEVVKVLNITNIEKEIPEGTCEAVIYSDKTSISVTMKSNNYISGYNYYTDSSSSGFIQYNYYDSSTKNPSSIYVIAKDYVGNEGRIECTKTDKKSNFDPQGIRTVLTEPSRLTFAITDALARKGYTFNDFNMCIYNRVKDAGPYTRYGVAAAAYGLIECSYTMTGYRLPYSHTASMVGDAKSCRDHADICGKLGASPRWGTPGGQCGVKSDGTKKQCYQGHNCATFVHWSMCNGGMDLCSRGDNTAFGMADIKYFPEADAVGIKGSKVSHVYGVDYSNLPASTLVRMLKPGDIIASSEGDGHVFVVVGYDDNGIYTAEDGYYMRNLKYSTLTNGQQSYRLMFLDRYYANPKNYNYLYG